MRLSLSILFTICAVLLCARPILASEAAGAVPPPGRAALVNGSPITAQCFENEVRRQERLSLRGKKPARVGRKQVLEILIVRELLYQEALKQGVRVPADEVGLQLAQLSERLPGDAGLQGALDQMGLDPGALEEQLKRGLTIQKYLIGNLSRGARVSEAEIASFYREHREEYRQPLRLRLSHILVKADPSWGAEKLLDARGKLDDLKIRLSGGEDFAALAREASDCYSALNGGDLGYFQAGQLSKKLEDAALALKPGQVSGLVEDRYGLHLLKLTELRPEALLPLEKVRNQIRDTLLEKALPPKDLAPLVRKLRAAAKVEILLNENE